MRRMQALFFVPIWLGIKKRIVSWSSISILAWCVLLSLSLSSPARAELLTLSFADPVEDHLQLSPIRRLNPPPSAAVADLVELTFDFDNSTGNYEIVVTSSATNPFIGFVRINVQLFNPDTGTTAQDPAFFRKILVDFMLESPSTTIRITGTDSKLLAWKLGDRVALCHGSSFVELGPCQGSLGLPDGIIGFGAGSINSDVPPPFPPSAPSGTGRDTFYTSPPAVIVAATKVVEIDIKPGDKYNAISPHSRGGIWIAVLSNNEFDPLQIDISTVRFGSDGAEAIRHRVKDVDKDGLGDLLLRFKTSQTGIVCGDTGATLTGETFGGHEITGMDSIKTVGC